MISNNHLLFYYFLNHFLHVIRRNKDSAGDDTIWKTEIGSS